MHLSPHQLYGALFEAVQEGHLFADSKTFADAVPRFAVPYILEKWEQQRLMPHFDLRQFVEQHFILPGICDSDFRTDLDKTIAAHIESLWPVLTRNADEPVPGSSLLPLPFPYIVPGGRFGEIYYWDSYFTMLGLSVSDRYDLIRSMVQNFAYLIRTFGFIPNGNRTYFLSRSQPPFFSLMVELLAEKEDKPSVYDEFLDAMIMEYEFWTGNPAFSTHTMPAERYVPMPDACFLNRYWDNSPSPREESWREDVELARRSTQAPESLFRNIRAACESGWDFSSRWCTKPNDLTTIRTTEILPVDLNCLMYYLETSLEGAFRLQRKNEEARLFAVRSAARRNAIHRYFWNETIGCFTDYDYAKRQPLNLVSAAMFFPLFFKIATPWQAQKTARMAELQLLRPGGIVTTALHSGQQWDAPNGWAPLQWIAIQGLRNYQNHYLADIIKNNWITLNTRVFQQTGKLLEKYNVEDTDLLAGGGEYPVQDGFGWTNGVLLALLR